MARKLSPALWYLFERNLLPKPFSVFGFGRREYDDQAFRAHISQSLTTSFSQAKGKELEKFLDLFFYHRSFFDDESGYKKLAQRLGKVDAGWQTCSNKLFYLAVPPEHYETIFLYLHSSGLTDPCSEEEGWSRILVEKPFGKDLLHAEDLDKILESLFKEEQVYRIDHYLAKETLQNIVAFRFANNLLEDVWNRVFIEKIEIKLLEEIDVEGRGSFYDGVGALLDVGQNHLLQMLALVTMDNPGNFTPEAIRTKRAEILEKIRIPNTQEIKENTFRAQYRGYLKERGVTPNSQTETYFRLQTNIDSSRWRGVPVILESGKKLPQVQKEIVVTFRHPTPCLCPKENNQHYQNRVIFRIQPKPGISIQFWSKKPGSKMELEEQFLDFNYPSTGVTARYLEEYAKLLVDVLIGDQTLFVSSRETMAGWKYIDPIVKSWQKGLVPLPTYEKEEKVFSSARFIDEESEKLVRRVGIVGLGKMGKNLTLRLIDRGWEVVGYNRTAQVVEEMEGTPHFKGASSFEELVKKLPSPKIVWLTLPQATVEEILFEKGLVKLLGEGDIVVEGGNSFYKDSIQRSKELAQRGIEFVDVGISGGPGGARSGACLMVGGKEETFKKLKPLFQAAAKEGGLEFFPGVGAGHFVKMIHNGIEYGMMQSIAEGFATLKKSPYNLDLSRVASVYNNGSVIESRLIGWLQKAFEERSEDLESISGSVGHTGEGEWSVKTAKEYKVKTPIIEGSFKFRVASEKDPSYIGQVLSALREQFGGHKVVKD